MLKKNVVAFMIAAAFLGALIAVMSFLKKNESITYNKNYTWYVDFDSAGSGDMLVRGGKINELRGDVNKLISALNKTVEEAEIVRSQGEGAKTEFPKIILQKIEQRTAIIEILNDEYLTSRMGSSGAQGYLAEVTYTLTENPAVKSVNFLFHEGDHAMPGIYSRESFTSYKIMTGDVGKR